MAVFAGSKVPDLNSILCIVGICIFGCSVQSDLSVMVIRDSLAKNICEGILAQVCSFGCDVRQFGNQDVIQDITLRSCGRISVLIVLAVTSTVFSGCDAICGVAATVGNVCAVVCIHCEIIIVFVIVSYDQGIGSV